MENILKTIGPWIPFLSLAISIISVIFALYQIRNLVRSIHSQTYQRIYELMINIDKFFIENPGLKPYFYPDTNIPPEENVDRDKLFSIAEMMMDYFDNVYHQQDCMPAHTFDGFGRYMRKVFQHSQILRDYLALSGREMWYPSDFLECLKGDSKNVTEHR